MYLLSCKSALRAQNIYTRTPVDGFLGPEGHCVDAKHTASTLRGLPENNLGELPVADLCALILHAAQNLDMGTQICPNFLLSLNPL